MPPGKLIVAGERTSMAVGHLVTLPDRPLFNCYSSPHGQPQPEPGQDRAELGQGNVSILKTTTMRGKWQKFWVTRGSSRRSKQRRSEPRLQVRKLSWSRDVEAQAEDKQRTDTGMG